MAPINKQDAVTMRERFNARTQTQKERFVRPSGAEDVSDGPGVRLGDPLQQTGELPERRGAGVRLSDNACTRIMHLLPRDFCLRAFGDDVTEFCRCQRRVVCEGLLDDVFDPQRRHGCLEDGAAVRDVADDVELPVPSPPEPDLEVALRVDSSDAEARPVAPRHPVRPLLPRRRFPDEAGSLFHPDEARLAGVHLYASSSFRLLLSVLHDVFLSRLWESPLSLVIPLRIGQI